MEWTARWILQLRIVQDTAVKENTGTAVEQKSMTQICGKKKRCIAFRHANLLSKAQNKNNLFGSKAAGI